MPEDVELSIADVIKQLLIIGWEQSANDTEELKSCLEELSSELGKPGMMRQEKADKSMPTMAVAYLRLLGSLRPALENRKVFKVMRGKKVNLLSFVKINYQVEPPT